MSYRLTRRKNRNSYGNKGLSSLIFDLLPATLIGGQELIILISLSPIASHGCSDDGSQNTYTGNPFNLVILPNGIPGHHFREGSAHGISIAAVVGVTYPADIHEAEFEGSGMDAGPLDVVLFSLAFCSDSLHLEGEGGRGMGGRVARDCGRDVMGSRGMGDPGGILSNEHLQGSGTGHWTRDACVDDGIWEVARGVKIASEMDVRVSGVGGYGVEKGLDDGGERSWGGIVDDKGLDHGSDGRGIEGLEKGISDELLGDDLGEMVVGLGRRGVDGRGRGGLERRDRRKGRVLDNGLRDICRRCAALCIRRRPRCRRCRPRTDHGARTFFCCLFGGAGSSFELAAGATKRVLEPVVYLLARVSGGRERRNTRDTSRKRRSDSSMVRNSGGSPKRTTNSAARSRANFLASPRTGPCERRSNSVR